MGFRRSVIRGKLVELLRRIFMPVRRGNRNLVTAVLGQFGGLFEGIRSRFAPKYDPTARVRSCDQKPHSNNLRARYGGRGCALIGQLTARATTPEKSRTTPATVTARKLLEANSSRMVHHRSLSPCSKGTTHPLHSQSVSFRKLNFDGGRCVSATPRLRHNSMNGRRSSRGCALAVKCICARRR
jgi:hypothetical protein